MKQHSLEPKRKEEKELISKTADLFKRRKMI
jgi:hypothetical protein